MKLQLIAAANGRTWRSRVKDPSGSVIIVRAVASKVRAVASKAGAPGAFRRSLRISRR